MISRTHKYLNLRYFWIRLKFECCCSDKGLHYTEWLRLLSVSQDSALARALAAADKVTTSPLLSFLEAVVKSCGRGMESAAVQTEAVTLQEKLNQLDEKYVELPAGHFLSEQDKHLQNIYKDNQHIQDVVKLEVRVNSSSSKYQNSEIFFVILLF